MEDTPDEVITRMYKEHKQQAVLETGRLRPFLGIRCLEAYGGLL
jgi:hypothetical protein